MLLKTFHEAFAVNNKPNVISFSNQLSINMRLNIKTYSFSLLLDDFTGNDHSPADCGRL